MWQSLIEKKRMCNAWNHPSGCQCGWGGEGSTGGSNGRGYSHFDSLFRDSYEGKRTYKTKCWHCGKDVFFHTNGNGDCVLFDELGHPWPVHPCWARYCRTKNSSTVTSFPLGIQSLRPIDQKAILIEGVLEYLEKSKIPATPRKVGVVQKWGILGNKAGQIQPLSDDGL